MSEVLFNVFSPRDGAALDLGSLLALADVPHDLLAAALGTVWPGANGMILHGLELVGNQSPSGPPGSVRPDSERNHALVTAGAAMIRSRDGRMHLLTVDDPVHCPWPDSSGPRVRGVLVAYADTINAATEDGISVARDEVTVRLGFVKPRMADQPHLLKIAEAVGNGRDWATDLGRILQPEHSTIEGLLKRFENLEMVIWQAEPEGSVWDRQVLGRSWVRYQTVAASAMQAARTTLATRAMTTLDRVRVLVNLRRQLENSVERAATELIQMVGPPEAAGPYEAVLGNAQ